MKKYHNQNRAVFFGAILSVFSSNLFATVLQFFKGNVLDSAVAGDGSATLHASLLLILSIGCEVLFYFCFRRLSAKYAVECTKGLKQDVFVSILRRDYPAYKELSQGQYLSKYTSEADTIRSRRFELLPLFWEILSKILLVTTALFLLDWRIALITLALLSTPLYLPKLIEKPLQKAQAEYLKAVEETLAKVSDWLSGFEIIKNFSAERKIHTLFQKANNTSMKKLLMDQKLGAAAQLITTLISYLSYFIVLACAAWLVLNGDFSAGDFFVAIGMIDQLSYPLISLAEIIRQLVAIAPACTAMEQFLSASAKTEPEKKCIHFQHEIRFRDVSFAYPGQREILHHLNLTIQKGDFCLLRGPSGCGKTTLVNLLLRYYDPVGGSITMDDVALRETGNPYRSITVVRQEAVLFRDTLRNNLTMYRDIPDEALLETLRRVGLEQFASVAALNDMVTESGSNFSGGEKKRICLARALLRDTEILILDEPLANLDEDTAGRIEDLLLSIRGKTILIVSHQFSPEKLPMFQKILDL